MRGKLLGLVVVLLAVALGIAVGAGPLQGDARARQQELTAALAQVSDLEGRLADARRGADFTEKVTESTAPEVVAGRLKGRRVALLVIGRADQDTVARTRELLAAAGASLTAEVSLTPTAVDPARRALVEALTTQMATQAKLDVGSQDGYQRLGTLLGRAMLASPVTVSRPSGRLSPAQRARRQQQLADATARAQSYDQVAVGVVAGLRAADLLADSSIDSRADLLLVLVPGGGATTGQTTADLVRAAAGAPTVVAGPLAAAGPKRVLTLLGEAGSGLSTVDGNENEAGRVVTVLALAAQADGTSGQYGATGADALPPAAG